MSAKVWRTALTAVSGLRPLRSCAGLPACWLGERGSAIAVTLNCVGLQQAAPAAHYAAGKREVIVMAKCLALRGSRRSVSA